MVKIKDVSMYLADIPIICPVCRICEAESLIKGLVLGGIE
jgi:hypothetical protein